MNNATKGKAMKLLTPGFTVTDKQSAPSGYYRLSFRSSTGDYVVATQHARGSGVVQQAAVMLELVQP